MKKLSIYVVDNRKTVEKISTTKKCGKIGCRTKMIFTKAADENKKAAENCPKIQVPTSGGTWQKI